ncbi:M48 family metallopeptidase [Noviherbaspirillum sp. L7-7A]|uniref:M48 family metallopeptidase n=1 Tax=Noviherbaspirillum sp. L7-7A TaxID=2850560 RepID=UPI002011AFC6|nr:M48 family metallopeptidase [Noviherbaspirillum sp. L7-7A]
MMKKLPLISALLFCLASPALPAMAQQDEGVAVERMSRLRGLIPEKQLEEQATMQYQELKQQAAQKGVLAPDTDPQLQRVRAISRRIISQATRWNQGAADWQWEVNLIKADNVNAFCMPGGKIAFFSGLVDQLKLTDDEIAIVAGHEIAHALREHGRERVAKGSLLQLGANLGSAIFGLGQLGQTVVGQGAQLALLRFSREDETEADTVGLDLVARAGYDPRAGVALWRKMAMLEKSAPPQWLSSHPSGNNRISQIQKTLPQVMPVYARAVNAQPGALPPYRSNVKGVAPVQ